RATSSPSQSRSRRSDVHFIRQEFGIDVVGKDNKTIVQHGQPPLASFACFKGQEARLVAHIEPRQDPPPLLLLSSSHPSVQPPLTLLTGRMPLRATRPCTVHHKVTTRLVRATIVTKLPLSSFARLPNKKHSSLPASSLIKIFVRFTFPSQPGSSNGMTNGTTITLNFTGTQSGTGKARHPAIQVIRQLALGGVGGLDANVPTGEEWHLL
ncbi:hypothetical protein BJV77DRAFT_1014464, partial [Russula vinacea]